MATKGFIALGVFSMELLACQVSKISFGQDSSIYINDVVLG